MSRKLFWTVFLSCLMPVFLLVVFLRWQAELTRVMGTAGILGSFGVLFALMIFNAAYVIMRYRSFERQNRELSAIYNIAQSITASSFDPGEALQTILLSVARIIAYDGAEICLYEPAEGGVRVRAWRSNFGEDSRGRLYKLGEGFTGGMAQTRTSMLVPDILKHPTIRAVYSKLSDKMSVRSFVGTPLVGDGQLVGTIQLVSTKPNKFTERSRQLLEAIAPQASIAIQTAHRVEERERMLREQINMLRIEIDEVKRSRQVAEITDTEYFRQLKQRAKRPSQE